MLIHISGLQRKTSYSVSLRVASSDNYRYKYLNCEWRAVGESEVIQEEKKMTVEHSNSPRHGSFWTNKPVSFKSVKITHSPNSKHGDVSKLTSIFLYCGAWLIMLPKKLHDGL